MYYSKQPGDFRIDPRLTYMTRGQGLTVNIQEMEYPYEKYVRVTYLNKLRAMVHINTGKASSQGMEDYDLLYVPIDESKIEDKTHLFVTRSQILGKFAEYAIRQSPYTVPFDLEIALLRLSAKLDKEFNKYRNFPADMNDHWYEVFTDKEVFTKGIYAVIKEVPEIQSWNERRNKREGYGFVSAYDGPTNPDDDFVDLDALVGNVVRELYNEHGSTKEAWEKKSEDENDE